MNQLLIPTTAILGAIVCPPSCGNIKKFGTVLILASTLLLTGCRMNGRNEGGRIPKVSPELSVTQNMEEDELPYSWMSDDEVAKYYSFKNDTVWQDSLARILSSRLKKEVHMDDFLKLTYSDRENLYYWNDSWGDVLPVPAGFEVSEQVNWFWKAPNGASFTGVVDGKDSVAVYVSASLQVAFVDEDEFREYFQEESKAHLKEVNCSFKRGRVEDGQSQSYLYCTYEGKNVSTGKGEFHKDIYKLPGSDGSFAMKIVYPLPKSKGVENLIKSLSSYPNITDVSQYGAAMD